MWRNVLKVPLLHQAKYLVYLSHLTLNLFISLECCKVKAVKHKETLLQRLSFRNRILVSKYLLQIRERKIVHLDFSLIDEVSKDTRSLIIIHIFLSHQLQGGGEGIYGDLMCIHQQCNLNSKHCTFQVIDVKRL